MSKNTLILLVGPSCSGKDSILNQIVHAIPSIKKLKRCITREPREGETGDPDIEFNTLDQCNAISSDKKMDSRSYEMYNNKGKPITVFYANLVPQELLGVEKRCENTYIGITTLDGLLQIDGNKLITEYFNIVGINVVVSEDVRIKRYINRVSKDKNSISYNTVKEILRRMDKDREDFSKERISTICKQLKNIAVWPVDGSRNLSVVTTDVKHLMMNKMNKSETLKAIESILLKFKDDTAELIRDRNSIDASTCAKISSYPANLLKEIIKEAY